MSKCKSNLVIRGNVVYTESLTLHCTDYLREKVNRSEGVTSQRTEKVRLNQEGEDPKVNNTT